VKFSHAVREEPLVQSLLRYMPKMEKPEMEETVNAAVVEWAKGIRIDQIPGLLLFLVARWLAETRPKTDVECNALSEAEKLLTAGEVAKHLNVPESWVRTEERLGRIPSVRLGKYVRFRLSEVEYTLAKNQRRRP
jgi:excisionase family DNA binding protein